MRLYLLLYPLSTRPSASRVLQTEAKPCGDPGSDWILLCDMWTKRSELCIPSIPESWRWEVFSLSLMSHHMMGEDVHSEHDVITMWFMSLI
ncbi:hypothetical protein GDO81_014084 [Engystomops pustulosus]|uniref:Uncharacterized protein n=1 Tax=Engystomops pustulosus TaxID=76066 RepID=A0AAV7B7X3_ENGPU|nr:hypothetical protein GDO81_014084 [Engystomops pustulosus]